MTDNFHTRLRVETTYAPGEVRDHREGFTQQEYFRNQQKNPKQTDAAGFPPMESVTQPSKPKGGVKQRRKTKQDEQLEQAIDKDLSKRNVRRTSN